MHYKKGGHIASRKQQNNSLCLAVNPPHFDKGGKNVVRSEGMLSFYNDCGNYSIMTRICCVCG
ncbi:MAG: hypothetical protein EGR86_08930 [Ruminiclostridium sp.]|nr:hypothetical protein [Ruminiclostridium sp.]